MHGGKKITLARKWRFYASIFARSKLLTQLADAIVFMRPFEIYRAALYNVYGGLRVTYVPYIIGASLSEPHIDDTNVRNPYIIIIMYRTSIRAPLYVLYSRSL